MDENKQTNPDSAKPAALSPEPGVYNLEGGDKKPSILGKLLGSVLPGNKTAAGETSAVSGSALGAAIGAEIAAENKALESAPRISSIAQLLGPKPEFNPALIEAAARRSEKRARAVFYVAVVFAVVVASYVHINLTTERYFITDLLGTNSAQQFEQSNAEVKKLQTDINIVQYRIARLWLDIINSKSDAFTQAYIASQSAKTLTERTAAQQVSDKTSGEIRDSLIAMQKIFVQDLGVDTYTPMPVSYQEREAQFADLLKKALADQQQSLHGSAKDKNASDTDRAIDNVIRLVNNKRVRSLVRGAAVKTMTNDQLVKLIADIRSEGIDEFAQVEKIKQQRIDWEALINNIHAVVQSADPHYGHGLFKTVGGFMFSTYTFDQKTSRVTISGVTRTADSKTFSFIATLIDAIEKSPHFKDIDFRSFSKTRDESGDYSAGVNLEFGIEK